MKLQTCFSIPGLERYPKRERFAKRQAIHKQLLRDDAQYRKRFNSFLTTIIFLSCPLLAVYGYYFGIGLTSLAANLTIIFCVTATIVYLSLRQMYFMNQRIGHYLQTNHDA